MTVSPTVIQQFNPLKSDLVILELLYILLYFCSLYCPHVRGLFETGALPLFFKPDLHSMALDLTFVFSTLKVAPGHTLPRASRVLLSHSIVDRWTSLLSRLVLQLAIMYPAFQ
jgi:hypothetical protein